MKEIYLDSAATTKVHDKVVKEMNFYFGKEYGNPSSNHEVGERGLKALTQARTHLAREIGVKAHEIIFTSGATESNNLALLGSAHNSKKKKIIVSSIEHASVLAPCDYLASWGYTIVKIPVNSHGLVDLTRLEKEIDDNTLLVSIMHANNVIGTLQDLALIGKVCLKKNVIFHTDAAQSFGKIKLNARNLNIDMMSASAHKIGGPKGIGLLYVKEGVNLGAVMFGGGQERGLRSGTENVPGAVGFSKAFEIVKQTDWAKLEKIREILIANLEKIGGIVNQVAKNNLPNIINVSFPGCDSEMLVTRLSTKGIFVSSGSACDSRGEKEDYVLKAIGLKDKEIRGSIRISLPFWEKEIPVKKIISGFESCLKIC